MTTKRSRIRIGVRRQVPFGQELTECRHTLASR
jgi:hypothetical protein